MKSFRLSLFPKYIVHKSPSLFISHYSLHTDVSSKMKISSWNVAGFKAVLKKGFLDFVEQEKPDVICLQETKIKEEEALKTNLPANYNCYFCASVKSGYAGVGLMCKEKPISLTKGLGKEEHDVEGRVITAEFKDFYIVNTYVPNSGENLKRLEYRLNNWDVDMLSYLQHLEKTKPVIWCGDLNVAHKPIDIKHPKANKRSPGFTEEERNNFTKMLETTEYVDTFRHFYPDKIGAYTYWSQRAATARANNSGWRLDYFVVSKTLLPSIKDSIICSSVKGSDHCPITLEVVTPQST